MVTRGTKIFWCWPTLLYKFSHRAQSIHCATLRVTREEIDVTRSI